MKMFNKSECEYKGGYIVCNGKVVCVDNKVVDLLNKLDVDVQRAQFEADHSVAAGPVEEFVPVSEYNDYPVVEAATPELDKMVDHAIKIMYEVDAVASAEKTNEYFAGIRPLIQFVASEFIVSGEQATQHRFDLPTIGNPLELDKDDLGDFVMSLFM